MDPNYSQVENKFLSKKNIIAILVVGILFLSIPFAVKMVQQQQTIRSKASATDVINFTGSGVNCDKDPCTTTSKTIQIELRPPVSGGSQI